MNKTRLSLLLFLFATLFFSISAKADTLVCGTGCTDNGTSFTWTGILVTGQLTSGEYAPTRSTDSVTLWYGGTGTEAVAIDSCTANCGTVTPDSTNPYGSNAAYATLVQGVAGAGFAINNSLMTTLGPPPSNIACAENGAQCNYYDYTQSTVCWGNLCLVPGNGTIRDITLVSPGSGDFIVQGNGIVLTFSLPEGTAGVTGDPGGPGDPVDPGDPPVDTPEPSAGALLGVALLGFGPVALRLKRLA